VKAGQTRRTRLAFTGLDDHGNKKLRNETKIPKANVTKEIGIPKPIIILLKRLLNHV
jgi:hypothetical protein